MAADQLTRLKELIEFAQQTAIMRSRPVSDVNRYNLFTEYDYNFSELPGIQLNKMSDNEEDEIWLVIERLHETPVPKINNFLLNAWVELSDNPAREPYIKKYTETHKLSEMGAFHSGADSINNSRGFVSFDSYAQKDYIAKQFKEYLANLWLPWSLIEKPKRRTISFYSKLFTLKQQLEGGIVDAQIELVWGTGIARWKYSGTDAINYPVITRLAELSLNERTMAIEVRPRDVEPQIELEIYSATDNPGVIQLEKVAKEFFGELTSTFSPFEKSTYEPLLISAAALLDDRGVYYERGIKGRESSLELQDEGLKILNNWIIFARPRGASLFVQDLARFKNKLEEELTILPNAVEALVTDPAVENEDIILPPFRGISAIYGSDNHNDKSPQDLFFPMAFNDEQVRIVQLLESSDGVIVQGPPGTGKTHTIANIICHNLALGRRVLVTSMKDPALAVLQEKLPLNIRALAVSLLSSEKDGMKQFEHTISKIASEVQRVDKRLWSEEILFLEQTIDGYHSNLIKTDRQISHWAIKNLSKIDLDGELIEPLEAARQVISFAGQTELFSDTISIDPKFKPCFNDSDILSLREARRVLLGDIDYLDAHLPQINSFPDSREIVHAHQDLIHFNELQSLIDNGEIPRLVNSHKETYDTAYKLSMDIATLKNLKQQIKNANAPWCGNIIERIGKNEHDEILELFVKLAKELLEETALNHKFLQRPLTIQDDIDKNDTVVSAIQNLSAGKSAFGLAGLFGKGTEKAILDSVRILNESPKSCEDWAYVLSYIEHLKNLRVLITRWNALAQELNIPIFSAEPANASKIMEVIRLYQKIDESVKAEKDVTSLLKKLVPQWIKVQSCLSDESILDVAEKIILHHLTKNKLADIWALKERFQQVLTGCNGRISGAIHEFLDKSLGNNELSESKIQSQWTSLMDELRRTYELKPYLENVSHVTDLIEISGAKDWANRLRSVPHTAADNNDELLPENWSEMWRLKRLSAYLETIDGRFELKRLSDRRAELEKDLAKAYQEIVTKRTWLKLSENATPDVRSALMAYLSAIAKIGKGTGKRAVRYRQDARRAAHKANHAIPSWIMPHYRISESLPSEFGSFDLVIIDEASQSDLAALPAILRAKKILVVGDDKQVSPEGVGLDEDKILNLMERFLAHQVEIFRPQMTPERSIYDLFKVVFAKSSVMLKEHFRCVGPIIEYSKREFYNHEIKPLRIPKLSERLDPALIDVIMNKSIRNDDVNPGEARFIVDEIAAISKDPQMSDRSIGVVSLLGEKQAFKIWEMLEEEVGLEIIQHHRITCGDARTFQGKERDIMFLSMVVSKDNAVALSRDTFAQRFNVAASRAKDRMYLVRSILMEDLSIKDHLRRSLISHFSRPFGQDEMGADTLRDKCESWFEREIFDFLTERGYRVIPQVAADDFRIDIVAEGFQDRRLAIECDGDKYHGPEKWHDEMRCQRTLERAGWQFWRCFASAYVLKRKGILEDLIRTLSESGVEPVGKSGRVKNQITEQRTISYE